MSERLLQFRAGRCVRQGDSNTVAPQPDRGLVYLQEEDGLLHFCYKDLASGRVDEDLIIFPGDASFHRATDRVHVLKFNSSSARHFFWHQDPQLDPSEFEQRGRRVNELIGAEEGGDQEGDAAPGRMDVEPTTTEDRSMSDAATSPTATVPSAAAPGSSAPQGQAEQLAQLQNILAGLGGSGPSSGGNSGAGGTMPEYTLPDVLTPSAATDLIASLAPSALASLSSFLPAGVSSLPLSSPEEQRASLLRAVRSPEFRRALASLERALRTGATGPLVMGLGMEGRAANGTEEFLEEVQRQADREGGDGGAEGNASQGGNGGGSA